MKLTAYEYDTDKSQLYLDNYMRHFCDYLGRDIRLLELGVHTGGSLIMWADYFPQGIIAGVDKDVSNVKIPNEYFRRDRPTFIVTAKGDVTDPKTLYAVSDEVAPDGWDIIIDDASHIARETGDSMHHLWPCLKKGGLYVIEDWCVGYWAQWPDGMQYSTTLDSTTEFPSHNAGLVGFIKFLMDDLGKETRTNPKRCNENNGNLLVPMFEYIEVTPGQAFFRKGGISFAELIEEQRNHTR